MLSHLKKLFAVKPTGKQKIVQHTPQQTQLASAVILLEAAHVDNECSVEEMIHITSTVQSAFQLSDGDTAELLELASEAREHEVDLWQFTNHINTEFSHQEKIEIVKNVWEIILVDGHLEQHEDHFAHKLANLLRLSHKELIDAKMKVKNSRG